MAKKRQKNGNKHLIGEMVIKTSSNRHAETPEVFIFQIGFDFNGITTVERYGKMTDQLYEYVYSLYKSKEKKIISIDLPSLESRWEEGRFNGKTHHCTVEVYLRNEENKTFDEWECELITDRISPICSELERIFFENGFFLKKKLKKTSKIFG